MGKNKHIPRHVGIILDGNRRWARKHDLKTYEGHRRGYERAVDIGEHAFERGISVLTLFVFSTENWNRSATEVSYLMKLLLLMIESESKRLHAKGIRFKVIGSAKGLTKRMSNAIHRAESLTQHNTKGTLQVAFNYGGRLEIVDAVNELLKSGYTRISEQNISDHLYTAGSIDPDLIIRTSGELRLSGFLLWQSAYSELYFTSKMWPAFTRRDFDAAINDFTKRKRRFGA